MRLKLAFPALVLGFLPSVQAHCPLCTIGAAAAAGGASYLGVGSAPIGVFIGAFGASMGWWIAKRLPQKIAHQTAVLTVFSWVLTVLPLLPLLGAPRGLYVSLAGTYGSLLNRTYVVDVFLIGSLFGLAAMWLAPWLSRRITAFRGKAIPFQGVALTFGLLFMAAGLMEVFW